MINEEFFKEAFKGYEVPENLKSISTSICSKFNINGICDPMYICNSIAYDLGIGNGSGKFNNNPIDTAKTEKTIDYLFSAYRCNIKDKEDLKNIIQGGLL